MLKVYVTNPNEFGNVHLYCTVYLNGNISYSDVTIGRSIKDVIIKRFPYEKFGTVRYVISCEPSAIHSVYLSVDYV